MSTVQTFGKEVGPVSAEEQIKLTRMTKAGG